MFRFGFLFLALAALAASATVVTFNPSEVGGGVSPGNSVTTQWSAFGITADKVYLSQDSRDTFDTFGLAISPPLAEDQTASILFATPTTLSIDYLVLDGYSGTYNVYSAANVLLDSLQVNALRQDELGSYTFLGQDIARLDMVGTGGFVTVSTLRFDSGAAIPEPSSFLLAATGASVLLMLQRRMAKR